MRYLDLVREHEAARRAADDASDVAAVERLRAWLATGAIDALPDRVLALDGDLATYAERERLIGFVRAILAAVPWSLTAYDRAVQLVAVLGPMLDGAADDAGAKEVGH